MHSSFNADNASGTSDINSIREWWDQLNTLGPKYGYYANASKTWLVTKKDFLPKAEAAFEDTGVRITSEGRPGSTPGHRGVHSVLRSRQSQSMIKQSEPPCNHSTHSTPMLLMQPSPMG